MPLVEQNLPLALGVTDKVIVLRAAKIVREGDIEIFKISYLVREAYWGK